MGEAVRNSGIPREEIFVITKLYPNQFDHPETAIEEALEKLDIEYIDMMLLHHPGTGDVDAYLAMEKAVEDGKIRCLVWWLNNTVLRKLSPLFFIKGKQKLKNCAAALAGHRILFMQRCRKTLILVSLWV